MINYSENRRQRNDVNVHQEDMNFIFKGFILIVAILLFAVFAFIRYDIPSKVDHIIDHSLDIDVICNDCSTTVPYCPQYWSQEKKCGR